MAKNNYLRDSICKERIFFKDAETLWFSPLSELQLQAQEIRNAKNNKHIVSFVMDSNPNYTNICNVFCSFCSFYRTAKSIDAYSHDINSVMSIIQKSKELGAKTILLQGGINPELKINFFEQLIINFKNNFPEMHPHFFSAIEIIKCATYSNISLDEALQRLWDAGLRTIPGGGAEILSDSVHKQISPNKISPQEWLNFHKKAHILGFKTTCTMMFGHVETESDIILHLNRVRDLQDETNGFTSFIPWSFKSCNNALGKKIKRQYNCNLYFKILAFSRIYLDNFPHIGASWFSEEKEVGMKALHYGADDFGGTLLNENVHKCAGWNVKSNKSEVIQMIRSSGFIPAERDSFYNIINIFHD